MKKIEINYYVEVTRKQIFVFFGILFLFISIFYLKDYASAALTCTVASSCSDVVVFKMSGTSNAHAEMSDQSTYTQYVCCNGVTGLGNSCGTGTKATVGTLSSATNAHFEENDQTNYSSSYDVCLSLSGGGSLTVAYQASNCDGYDTTVASMAKDNTNAHIGNASAYTNKICASASAGTVSVTLDQESFAYGSIVSNTASSTLTLWSGAGITATNGGVTADFDIYGADSTGSGTGWTLSGNTTGNNYMHKFCDDTESDCTLPAGAANYTALTAVPQVLQANVAGNGTVSFQLQITTPTTPTDFSEQSAVITIQATGV